MQSRDSLGPNLSPEGQAMVKSFGGWTKFMETYNMKPHDQVDMWEAKRMVEKMALDSANPVVGEMSTKEEDSQGTYRSSLSSQSELSMSATIAGPELSERARGIIKSFGGWEKFMQTYGLKPHDQVDGWEAKRIIERMAQEDSTTSAPIEGSSKDNLGTHRPSLLVQPANPTFVDPHLTDAGRGIIKSFGGWDKFMQTYGLRPNNPVDMWEAKRIVERMAQEDTSTPNVVDSSTTKDSIDPHLSETGRGIIKSFGGWEKFMQTYGLNPHNQVDVWEAKRIIERMAQEEPSTSSGDNTKDSLGPPQLSATGRDILNSFGGWEKFMQTYGLKPNDQVDNWEAKRIVERMVQEDERRSLVSSM